MTDEKDLPEVDEAELDTEVQEDESSEVDEKSTEEHEIDEEGEDGDTEQARAKAEETQLSRSSDRRSARVQALANERKALRDKAEAIEQQNAELRKQFAEVLKAQQEGRNTHNAAAEAERLALMEPHERVAYEADKKIMEMRQQVAQIQFASVDTQDRSTFLSKASADPTRQEYATKVETALAEMRAKGMNTSRDDIYYYLLGKDLDSKRQGQGSKGTATSNKATASQRVAMARGAPVSARGDASTARRGKSLEERLADIPL